MTNWDDYRYFASLVQTGSVRATADHLGVNASTVTRRLDGLEGRLGATLFVRSHAGLELTADGDELIAALGPLVAQLGDLEQQLLHRGDAASGLVRITMADVFAVPLMPEFEAYGREHPAVRLEFLPGYRALDLGRGEADVALRATNQPPETLVGRKLGSYRMCLYGSRRYLAEHDLEAEPELMQWIESGIESNHAPGFKARHFPRVPLGVRCNNVLLQQAAVAAGMGVSLLPCVIGDPDERLARVLDLPPLQAQDIWLLFHPDLRGVARIQSISTFIQEAFLRLQPRLLGNQESP